MNFMTDSNMGDDGYMSPLDLPTCDKCDTTLEWMYDDVWKCPKCGEKIDMEYDYESEY